MTLLHLAAAAEGRPRIQIAADADDHDAEKALRHFNATALAEALPAARELISGVVHCPRCSRVLSQRFDRLGSTLFYDDDPRKLIQAFDRLDHDACTLRLLAACIIVYGRDRMPVATTH